MRISNLALNVDVDTSTNQLFIGGKPVQLDAGFIKNLVQEQLQTVDVQQAPPSQTRAKAAAKAVAKAPQAAPTKRGPGRPPKSQTQAKQAAPARGPGRPRKVVTDAKVVKKATSGTEGNGSHMAGVWAGPRAQRAKKGLCVFCTDNTKALPGKKFCKAHYEAKYGNRAAGK